MTFKELGELLLSFFGSISSKCWWDDGTFSPFTPPLLVFPKEWSLSGTDLLKKQQTKVGVKKCTICFEYLLYIYIYIMVIALHMEPTTRLNSYCAFCNIKKLHKKH
jgi:hypothetical protein